ncbi:hypothetical protein TI01_1194 [Lysobacter sp. A03]|nr:hypothetical protein TI01_1194 [Lysobacter sp. A03]
MSQAVDELPRIWSRPSRPTSSGPGSRRAEVGSGVCDALRSSPRPACCAHSPDATCGKAHPRCRPFDPAEHACKSQFVLNSVNKYATSHNLRQKLT